MLTVPKLELQPEEMATRMKATNLKLLTILINEMHFWRDSKKDSQNIKTKNVQYNILITHRLNGSKNHCNISSWKYIKGIVNPANNVICLPKFEDFSKQSKWFNGPDFLMVDKNDWTKDNTLLHDDD